MRRWVSLGLHLEFHTEDQWTNHHTCVRSRSSRPRREHPASGISQQAHVRDVRPQDPLEPENHEQYSQFET